MEIELINEENNHIKYGIIYTHDDIKECLDQEIEAIKPDVKVNGFRPGKVPSDYIFRMHGEKLRIQAMNKKVTNDIKGIIEQNKYELASQPIYNFRPRQDIDDNNFYVELELFIMPNLPAINFETVEINNYQPTEEAFQEILDKNLLMFQIMTTDFENLTDKPSQENDRITFSVEVTVEGEAVSGLSGQMQAILGHEQTPPEIEAQLNGVKAGQEIIYTHNYPADATDLFAPVLAGTETTYKIIIDKVERPIIRELDEERIKKIGFRDHDHLFQVLEGNTRGTLNNVSFNRMKHDFFKQLQELYKDIQIPEFMLKQEAYHVAISEMSATTDADVMEQITTGAIKLDISDKHLEDAKKFIHIGLFVRAYSKEHNISVLENELKRELEKYLPELTRLNSAKPEQKEQNYRLITTKARAGIMEMKVVQSVLSKVKTKEVFLPKEEYFNSIKIVLQ